MDLVFGLLNHPLIPYLVGAVVVLMVYKTYAPRLTVKGFNLTPDQFLLKVMTGYFQRKRLKESDRFRKQGNFLAAGKILEEEGEVEAAAEAYLEGNEYWAAAHNFETLGKLEKAAELYLQAN